MSIRLRGATYRYAGARRPALEDIDLDVAAGRVVGVVGPNEAGKSTLCLVASGLAPVVVGGRLDGSVTIDGLEIRTLQAHEIARRCGLLFQNPTAQLSGTAPTVFEEIAFGPRNLGLPVIEVVRRVERALETLGIGELADRDPVRLSGGQAQLVALASLIALGPDHLVLDEPTSQLDPQGTRIVGDALARVAREAGASVLVVEHKTALLADLVDDVVVIDAGRVVASGSAAEVLADPTLADRGVEPPPAVRLRRALADAGIEPPEAVGPLLAGTAT